MIYRSFFDNNLDALLLTTVDGQILAANKAACQLLEKTENVLIKEGSSGVLDLSDPRLKTVMQKRLSCGVVKERIRLKRGKNKLFESEITITSFDVENEDRTIISIRDVTKELENELELEKYKQQTDSIIQNLPGMVYRCLYDEKNTFDYVSDGVHKLTGYYARDFMSNKTLNYCNLIHEKYRDDVFEKIKSSIVSKSSFEVEYQIVDRKGQSRWVWERGHPVFDENGIIKYIEGYIEDISHQKNIERDLIKFTRAVEQNMSSIVLTDINGNIEYANQAFFDMTGFSRAEAVGENMRILKSGLVSADVFKDMWSTILNGNTWRGELINKKNNGELYWVNKAISPIIDSRGKISNFVSVAENITERKKAEEELIEAKERVEEVDRLKTAFLANMSHELRTPLNAVIGFSELIDDQMSKEQILEFSRTINQSGNHLLEIVEQIFDVSLLETGNMAIDQSIVDLFPLFSEFANEVVKMKAKHGKEHLTVDVKLPRKKQSYIVHADKKRLRQVMIHLLDNAVKFTGKGSIQYGFKPDGEYLLFWVADTGLGISETKQRMIFIMFNQVEQSYTRETGGLGIGLTVSQKLVELMGGTMWLESTLGKGSTFYFTIPLLQ